VDGGARNGGQKMANKRLIDANEVERKIRIAISSWQRDCNSNAPVIARAMEDALQRVIYATTVDAVEVVHGEWIMDDYTHRYRCSVCKAHQPYDTVGDYIDYWDCDYCPNCGAKMDGDVSG
jgi:rRNA maturation endonuclease Nob1